MIMKYVIYYNRKASNGETYKHYYLREGTSVMSPDFAIKFDDKLNAEKFIENELTGHFYIAEPYNQNA